MTTRNPFDPSDLSDDQTELDVYYRSGVISGARLD